MNDNKLKTKDIITIVLMSMINIFIFGFSSLLYLNPFTILLMPVYFAITQGIVYFMLGVKVPKKGAFLIYSIIQAIVTFNIPYIICYLLAGVIAEMIMAKIGYGNLKAMTFAYIETQLFNCFGSTIYPYAITLDATLARMPADGGVNSAFIEQAGNMIASWGSLVLMIVTGLCALFGAWLGIKIVKKHLLNNKTAK